jgi:hypothetical protein
MALQKIITKIENKFQGISITNHEGNSNMKIRVGFNLKNPFGPVAIVDCGSCENKYKENLRHFYTEFAVENQKLKCECGNIDTISYDNRLKIYNK